MTINPARLGRNQVAVLRAAANSMLIRFDGGGWAAESKACTDPARRVAELGLLAEGKRGAIVTWGGPTRPGVWMGLSAEGERVLQEWELANPEPAVADWRRREAIRALAGLTGDSLVAGVRDLAAAELGVDDGAFRAVARAVDGRPVIDNDNA